MNTSAIRRMSSPNASHQSAASPKTPVPTPRLQRIELREALTGDALRQVLDEAAQDLESLRDFFSKGVHAYDDIRRRIGMPAGKSGNTASQNERSDTLLTVLADLLNKTDTCQVEFTEIVLEHFDRILEKGMERIYSSAVVEDDAPAMPSAPKKRRK